MTTDLLRVSFYTLRRQAAPGVDGITWRQYETKLEDQLRQASEVGAVCGNCTYGSARGVVRKGHPYRDEFTTAVQILFCVVQVLCYVVGLVLSRIEPEGYLPMLSGGGDN